MGADHRRLASKSVPEIARSALTSMNNLWKDRVLNQETKARLMRTLVWPVATYGCESLTLKASDKRTAGFEMTAYRGMFWQAISE